MQAQALLPTFFSVRLFLTFCTKLFMCHHFPLPPGICLLVAKSTLHTVPGKQLRNGGILISWKWFDIVSAATYMCTLSVAEVVILSPTQLLTQ